MSSDDTPITLGRIYAVPDPWDTAEQCIRFTHADLLELDAAALELERDRLKLRLLLDSDPDPWLLERWAKIQQQLRLSRRRSA